MNSKLIIPEDKKPQFNDDSILIGKNWVKYMELLSPYWLFDGDFSKIACEKNSTVLLESMRFFNIYNCTIEKIDSIYEYLNARVKKYLSVAYMMNSSVCFGIIGVKNETSIVMGINPDTDDQTNTESIKKIIEGLLPDITLSKFKYKETEKKHFGVIGGTPSYMINDKMQTFDYSALTRALNGHDYTLLIMAKPVNPEIMSEKINSLTDIKDICLSISKRNISLQKSIGHTESNSNSDTKAHNVNVSVYGGKIVPFALGGSVGYGFSNSKTVTKTISDAITNSETLGVEIQNGFAIDLVKRVDNSVARLQKGLNTGFWQSVISFSTNEELSMKILQGCIYSEIAKPDQLALPPRLIEGNDFQKCNDFQNKKHSLIIPENIFDGKKETKDTICSYNNTEELSLLFSLPDRNIPGYELRTGKQYPLSSIKSNESTGIELGKVCDGHSVLDNTPFSISYKDLNKHTFVCGITGSGKTNTVKHILTSVDKPFWVIECAKKEYRKIAKVKNKKEIKIFTIGRPEINCISFNPFYIIEGISPQLHIDFLKDLFNASFSFYGPMPYILEKCLHEVYRKRGCNLSMDFNPHFKKTNGKPLYEESDYRYIFPTMQDLKSEVESYVKQMGYEGELSANIKTAILARLESLCVTAKGYMYNNNDAPDFYTLFDNNVVFELEGLADDADKAFFVGLLIIFLTEYRWHEKETSTEYPATLKHLLVIEEAHRLLKNISIEKTSEDMGNPKGKAVEHFTNLIAEMRSYGQGVIISEQIPSKIAPDVIKNSSNKIVHRIVARDDQNIIASMIGMEDYDAVFLGDQITGRALCHTEGMRLPISVAILNLDKDIIDRKDSEIQYKAEDENSKHVLKSKLRPCLFEIDAEIKRFLNTLLTLNKKNIEKAINDIREEGKKAVKLSDPLLLRDLKFDESIAEVISEYVLRRLFYGVYYSENIPESFINIIKNAIFAPSPNTIEELRKSCEQLDHGNNMAKHIISEHVLDYKYNNQKKNLNLDKLIRSYFLHVDEKTVNEISMDIKNREDNCERD